MIVRSLMAVTLFVAAAPSAAIKTFTATSGSPGVQGWLGQGGITSGATVTDLGQTAWQMTGNNCCGYWGAALTAQQWTDAFTFGWSLSGVVRTTGTSGVGFMDLDVPGASGRNRFDISFGNDGTNGWAGLSVFTDSTNPALKTTFSGNGYHLLDMRWDPGTQSASLWVDGVLALSGYTGHTQFRESHGPIFGVTGFTTQGLFQSVEFSINYPVSSSVPEPSTYALVGIGLVAWLRRRIAAQILLLAAIATVSAPAAVVGEALIDRPFVDGAVGDGYLYQGALPVGEQVLSFSFFNNNALNTNWITPMLLDPLPNGQYQIVGIGASRQNTGAGVQSYAFDLQSGSATVAAVDFVFGWWFGRISGGSFFPNAGVIEFSAAASNPGVRESCPAPNVGPCNISPTVGLTLPFQNNYTGPNPSGSLGAPNGRVYSVEVTTGTAAIPEPSTYALLLSGLALALRKRK
jgi:hypothetical protein